MIWFYSKESWIWLWAVYNDSLSEAEATELIHGQIHDLVNGRYWANCNIWFVFTDPGDSLVEDVL